MEPNTLRMLRGGVELAANAVEATVGAIAKTQETIVGRVYAPLTQPDTLTAPVQAIEAIQTSITSLIYQAVLGTSRTVALCAMAVLDRQEEQR